jgi:hypothetical protein
MMLRIDIVVFWRPFWIQNGHHSKTTMDINSQHHNLLGSQISSKLEDFCILAAIFDSKWRHYKNPPIWTKFGFQVDYGVAN